MANKLNVYEFGRQLLAANDLDPVYVLLWHSGFDDWTMQRWLLAYWAFYHVGTASWIACGDIGYWKRMEEAAGSKEYPRCHERRHFRGAAALKSVAWLKDRGLKELFRPLTYPHGKVSAKSIVAYVSTWYLFGPWIGFKVADMIERLGLTRVEFDLKTAFYKGSPTEGACLLWETERGVGSVGREAECCQYAAEQIIGELAPPVEVAFAKAGQKNPTLAPPGYERMLGLQEAETILCKWHSYMSGHYRIGEDVEACKKGLTRFPLCKTARQLLRAGERGGLW